MIDLFLVLSELDDTSVIMQTNSNTAVRKLVAWNLKLELTTDFHSF